MKFTKGKNFGFSKTNGNTEIIYFNIHILGFAISFTPKDIIALIMAITTLVAGYKIVMSNWQSFKTDLEQIKAGQNKQTTTDSLQNKNIKDISVAVKEINDRNRYKDTLEYFKYKGLVPIIIER